MASQSTFCSFFKRGSLDGINEIMRRFNRRMMSLFKQSVMDGESSPNLATVRFKCIAWGNYILHRCRSIILKSAAKVRVWGYIDELFVKLRQLEIGPR